jgi:hypothetical protein
MGKERDLELLEKQILNDAKNGDTTVLAEILESLDEEYIFNSLSDVNQERTNFQQLKGGERIVALVNTNGVSNSYNTPERIDIEKGTILRCPNSGTRMGHAFATLVRGNAVKYCRGHNEGEEREQKHGDIIGLSGGYNSAPYSLGCIDLRVWKIID